MFSTIKPTSIVSAIVKFFGVSRSEQPEVLAVYELKDDDFSWSVILDTVYEEIELPKTWGDYIDQYVDLDPDTFAEGYSVCRDIMQEEEWVSFVVWCNENGTPDYYASEYNYAICVYPDLAFVG